MLKNKLMAYAKLTRCHRPVGFFLLLWPTLWGVWIASNGQPPLKIVIIFIAGVFIMRPAGCIINDIADRQFDGYVKRTKDRPLATGLVSLSEALVLFFGLILVALGLVLFLSTKTILLAATALILAIVYPFCKRFTYLPQLVLGMAWYIGILMPFTELQNAIPANAWLLYLSAVTWTVAFDAMYAMADKVDDLKIGIKSIVILFGRYDKVMIGLIQCLTYLLWLGFGLLSNLAIYYYIALFFILILFFYQHYLIRSNLPNACIQAFTNNNWVGAVIFMGILSSLSC